MGADCPGLAPAGAPAERAGRRSLWPTAHPRRRAHSAGAGPRASRLSARLSRRRGAGRGVPPSGRLRSGARPRRPMVGGRHADPVAVGRGLCAREPPHRLAALPRCLPRAPRAAARPVLPGSSAGASRGGAVRRRGAPDRAADAGLVHRDVLRARVPGPLPRLHARRGRRPRRARGPRLSQDADRPRARPRHPAAAG